MTSGVTLAHTRHPNINHNYLLIDRRWVFILSWQV